MTEFELQQQRRHKWRTDSPGHAIRTLDDAREFIESVGFCLMYPLPPQQAKVGIAGALGKSTVLAPTFIGAYAGSEENLPTWQHAFADPRAQQASELMVRLLRERAAYEANLFGETGFLIAASIFPYFYALAGDRNPLDRSGKFSPLAQDIFEAIQRAGPIAKPRLREVLGGEPSAAAIDRALSELWSHLRITRVDYNPRDGAFWDTLLRWSSQAVNEGIHLSIAEALSALISKYLDCVVAAEPREVEDFFSSLVPRSKVKESVNALLATRELSFVHLGKRTLIQVTPPRAAAEMRPRSSRSRV